MTVSFTDTTAQPGASYAYTVDARNVAGASPPSDPVSISVPALPPAPPVGLKAGPVTATAVTVTCTPVAGATLYDLYRGGKLLAASQATLPLVDTTVAPGTSYAYQMAVHTAAGVSGLSAPLAVTTPALPLPPPPTGLKAVAGAGRVTLSWNAVAGVTSYVPYVSGTAYPAVTGLTATITGLLRQHSYTAAVASRNAAGTGAKSPKVGFTTT